MSCCPSCGKDLIIDQFEDCDLVYCSCGYTQMEECMCDECEKEYISNNGEVHPALINEDNHRRDQW